MASPNFVPNELSPQQQLAYLRSNIIARMHAGAGWFVWIAGLSVINTIAAASGGEFHFVLGLGVTDVVNALADRAGSAGILLDVVINGIAIGAFVLFWYFGKQGHRWAFVIGMALYAVDALILVLLQGSMFSILFHAYALYRVYKGFEAAGELMQLEARTQQMAGGYIQG